MKPVAPADLEATLQSLPQPWSGDALAEIRSILESGTLPKLVVLDDDPTGTQTVENMPVFTRWDVDSLKTAFADPAAGFFLLTNSRALTESQTTALHREIMANLSLAAAGTAYSVVSRSDSTLRGHYEIETRLIAAAMGDVALTVLAPFFEAGNRVTVNDNHYINEDGTLLPVHQSPFAEDKVFGYKNSNLPAWIEEKTKGRVAASAVVCIPLQTLRAGGPDAVFKILEKAPHGATCITNAIVQSDIEVFAAAVARLEASGKTILYRSAAAIVASRLGQRPPEPLDAAQLRNRSERGGLIVVGSYVPKTTQQLKALLDSKRVTPVELDVDTLLACESPETLIATTATQIDKLLDTGADVVFYTSRKLVASAQREDNLSIGNKVAQTLVDVTRSLKSPPGFVVAKGGITSSTIATDALEITHATVRGQILPGVPVWRADATARYPHIDLVIFPGNVGGTDALLQAHKKLSKQSSS